MSRLRGARQAGFREAGLTRALAVLAAGALLAGCNAIKLSYNKLDWIAAWQVGRFVELEPPQKRLFDHEFDEFWAWHRRTQLELYVRDIRELTARIDRPMPAEEVARWLERSRAHLAVSLREIAPETAGVLRTFDDAQVRELLEELADRRREKAAESADMSPEELQEEAVEQMERNLKRWTGPLTREQKARLQTWARERKYAGTIWHQYQEAWASAFTEVLKHRREPGFEQRLAALFGDAQVPYGAAMAEVQRYNRERWTQVIADLSAMLTPKQRAHLRAKLEELAADLTELAQQPRPGGGTAAQP